MHERNDAVAGVAEVAVVGSLNMDLRLTVDRLPHSGETISATGFKQSPGGKGGNQAVAAARLGRSVAMIGAVGADGAGVEIRERLAAEGLQIDAVAVRTDTATGTATILWEQPESTIVINAGANATVDEQFVLSVGPVLRDAAAVLCQCETPLGALEAVVNTARGLKILNPAPAMHIPTEIRDRFDILVPNRFELATLAGVPEAPRTHDDVVALTRELKFPGAVVVTLGEDGSIVVPPDADATHVAAVMVDTVDTTAAGDSFCAALADALLRGEDIVAAAAWAARVAALTTTKHGAIESLPHTSELHPLPR